MYFVCIRKNKQTIYCLVIFKIVFVLCILFLRFCVCQCLQIVLFTCIFYFTYIFRLLYTDELSFLVINVVVVVMLKTVY